MAKKRAASSSPKKDTTLADTTLADTTPAAAARVAPKRSPKSVPSSFKPSVAFLGDANFDQITARVEAPAAVSSTGNFLSSEPEVVCVRRPGGTWLLSDMLQFYCNELEAIPGVGSLECVTASPLPETSSFLNQAQSGVPEYVYVLRQFQRKPGAAGDRVLRVAERLGWMKPLLVPSRSSKDPQPNPPPEPLASLYDVKAPLFASRPAVAVVNDHGSRRAFRNRMKEPEYYEAVRSLLDQGYEDAGGSSTPVNLVWLAYAPVFESPLFELLKDLPDLAQRTLVIVNADCLSDAGVDVRFDMSFEQALQALLSTPR